MFRSLNAKINHHIFHNQDIRSSLFGIQNIVRTLVKQLSYLKKCDLTMLMQKIKNFKRNRKPRNVDEFFVTMKEFS